MADSTLQPYFKSDFACPPWGPWRYSHGSTLVETPSGDLLCAWYAGSYEKSDDVVLVLNTLPAGAEAWQTPRVLVEAPGKSVGNPVLFYGGGKLWLFYALMHVTGEASTTQTSGWTTCTLHYRTSTDGGATWSEEATLLDEWGFLTRNKPLVLQDGTWLLPLYDERDWTCLVLISKDEGATWERSEKIDGGGGFKHGNIQPALYQRSDGSVVALMRTGSKRYRTWRSVSHDGGRTWSKPVETDIPNVNAALDVVRLQSGEVLMVLNPSPLLDRDRITLWLSEDEGDTWRIWRDVPHGPGHAGYPALIQAQDGRFHLSFSCPNGAIQWCTFNLDWVRENALVAGEFKLPNLLPPLARFAEVLQRKPALDLPLESKPFFEHVRRFLPQVEQAALDEVKVQGEQVLVRSGEAWYAFDGASLQPCEAPDAEFSPLYSTPTGTLVEASDSGTPVTPGARLEAQGSEWVGLPTGLYQRPAGSTQPFERLETYGLSGPLCPHITALAVDEEDNLWVGTPLGLSVRSPAGEWRHVQGRDGLPVEHVTALAAGAPGDLWIGTARGLVLYRPQAEDRKWYYRAGKRYLPADEVRDVACSPDGKTVYTATAGGLGVLDLIETTLEARAQRLADLIELRHRRLDLVAECDLDDAEQPTSHVIHDKDNDGLWSAYHVGAASLCYAVTGDEKAREAARRTMHALYMLQNASGTPGLVARSVLPPELGRAKGPQWRPTPDGKLYWKSDTSSDEIDGHYFAFYTYWQHIARFDPDEDRLLQQQVRAVTDYLLDNGYLLIDWDGQVTTWGFWSPDILNRDGVHYLENGLNSLQILSFLKVAWTITHEPRYKHHYDYLVTRHGYLGNLLLEKKVFPDEENHSDSQLSFIAWYPLLQLEADPRVRDALLRAVLRHYAIIHPTHSSFFYFVTATAAPGWVDLELALENLRQIPTDRRNWRMENSHRADVVFDTRKGRFGERQLLEALPYDELDFAKWNRNYYVPDAGRDGRHEDDGAAWLLPYWLGRYHGLFVEST